MAITLRPPARHLQPTRSGPPEGRDNRFVGRNAPQAFCLFSLALAMISLEEGGNPICVSMNHKSKSPQAALSPQDPKMLIFSGVMTQRHGQFRPNYLAGTVQNLGLSPNLQMSGLATFLPSMAVNSGSMPIWRRRE
jgi:hypothetical protein